MMQYYKQGLSMFSSHLKQASQLQQYIIQRNIQTTAAIYRMPPDYSHPLGDYYNPKVVFQPARGTGRPRPAPYQFKIIPKTFGVRKIPSLEESQAEHEILSKEVVSEINEKLEQGEEGRLFAVVTIKENQYIVKANDLVMVEGVWEPNVGDVLKLSKILLVGGNDFTLTGRPVLPPDQAYIKATVVEKTLDRTDMMYRHRPVYRCRFSMLRFRKTPQTILRINTICLTKKLDERTEEERSSEAGVSH